MQTHNVNQTQAPGKRAAVVDSVFVSLVGMYIAKPPHADQHVRSHPHTYAPGVWCGPKPRARGIRSAHTAHNTPSQLVYCVPQTGHLSQFAAEEGDSCTAQCCGRKSRGFVTGSFMTRDRCGICGDHLAPSFRAAVLRQGGENQFKSSVRVPIFRREVFSTSVPQKWRKLNAPGLMPSRPTFARGRRS